MEVLPSSVEAYLEEAGFSGTEILILKRLLEGEAMTLRLLGLKTGKSTGVLDQATKKLLKKGILNRETINDVPMYALHSLQSIKEWMDRDMREKQEMLLRKHRNFESFVNALSRTKGRPDMEYFDGDEGLIKAYRKLLDANGEMLQYLPITTKEEDDPLREFRSQYTKERHRRGVGLRVIAHQTPLGLRFQSRDQFEHRETVLIEPEEYPFNLEQIIVGDIVACLDHTEKKACFLRYPQLADSQRHFFDRLWKRAKDPHASSGNHHDAPAAPSVEPSIVAFRKFFFSRRSIFLFTLCAILSAGLTYGLYRKNINLNLQRIQERVQSIATTGALQINPNDLKELQVESDWKKPQWAKVVNQLKDIRLKNDDILFVYLFRQSPTDSHKVVFVADSHSLNPYANTDGDTSNDVDANADGKIGTEDLLQWPGQQYDEAPVAAFDGLHGPAASDAYTDSWGTVVSGYAPVKDADGSVTAVLAVDVRAQKLDDLTSQTFAPILNLLIFFIAFVIVALLAFEHALIFSLIKTANLRVCLFVIFSSLVLSVVLTYGLYWHHLRINLERMREEVRSVAATGALQFDPKNLDALRVEDDWKKPEWSKVVSQLINIRENNKNIVFVYIMRKTNDNPSKIVFVSDSHSLNPFAKIDLNGDGIFDQQDALTFPGEVYDGPQGRVLAAFEEPVVERDFISDQWGNLLSGYAPIRDDEGKSIAILGIDMRAEKLQEFTQKDFQGLQYFLLSFSVLLFLQISAKYPFLNKCIS